jgi:hypothetical protein
MSWHWVQIDPNDPSFHTCGITNGPRGKVGCEFPPGHEGSWHTGRNRRGAWLNWYATEPGKF